jgi:predicted dehydrogenase
LAGVTFLTPIFEDYWEEACIVGFGSHAQSKIFPALRRSNIKSISLVSTSYFGQFGTLTVYRSLECALMRVKPKTLFIIASPPGVHFEQAHQILLANFDVFIEKPACLTEYHAGILSSVASKNGLILAEMLMYLEYDIINNFFVSVSSALEDLSSIEFNFLVPALPKKSFRSLPGNSVAAFSDFACYPISFLLGCGLSFKNSVWVLASETDIDVPLYKIKGYCDGVDIECTLGVANSYRNDVIVNYKNGSNSNFSPIFYGRNAERKFVNICELGIVDVQRHFLGNAFDKMFSKSRNFWSYNQNKRLKDLKEQSRMLECLGKLIKPLEE